MGNYIFGTKEKYRSVWGGVYWRCLLPVVIIIGAWRSNGLRIEGAQQFLGGLPPLFLRNGGVIRRGAGASGREDEGLRAPGTPPPLLRLLNCGEGFFFGRGRSVAWSWLYFQYLRRIPLYTFV